MGFFSINYDSLVTQLLPVRLRQPIMTAWIRALINPVKWLYCMFTTNRNHNLYVLAHSGQVCYLEAVLNDTFDSVLRGIYITDGAFEDPLFLYLDPETKPLWTGLESEAGTTPYPDPEVLYMDSETYSLGICFVVHVPVAVAGGSYYSLTRLKALVDAYRLPGRTNYSVITY
jgi:hypothetical protein